MENPIHAVGFSETEFRPFQPGRLCRGRERWIQPWELEEGEESPTLIRTVITGAAFVDDSARDAERGLSAAGIELTPLIDTLFPGAKMLVFTEDGHPADIPDDAEGIELYEGYRAGGRTTLPLVRWYKLIQDIQELDPLIRPENGERIRGIALVEEGTDLAALWEQLFLLVGMSTLDSPPARYQPAALPDVLQSARAIAILHRDKHGPALGIYSRDTLGLHDQLASFCAERSTLLVPFAIPPMLARWDRALSELRQVWEQSREEPFPVPRAATPSHWENRRGRRRRERQEAKEVKPAPAEALDPAADDATPIPSEVPTEE